MRTIALYCVLLGAITAALILFTTSGGPSFVKEQYKAYEPPSKPKGPPISHSQSHGWQTQREWKYEYPRDARNYGLGQDQCIVAFPELYKEIDRAVAWRKSNGKITLEDLDLGWRGDGIVRAMIYNNELYIIDPHGVWDQNHRPRALASLHSLHRAITAYQGVLPNVEFTMTDHDAPYIDQQDNHTTWGYSRLAHQEALWLMPDFGFWAWPDVGVRSYSEIHHILDQTEDDFLDKHQQVVWRGAVKNLGSSDVRAGLLKASEGHSWSAVQSLDWGNKTNIEERLLSMEDHCAYMFVAQTEGNTYSGRLKHLLNCNSVLLSHELQWIEHFHHLLKPSGKDQNYIKMKRDFSDLPKKMKAMLRPSNIVSAEAIANHARETFRQRYLTPAAEACYWRALIRGWAEVQEFKVEPWEEKEVKDVVNGGTKIKRKLRGAPFESFVIMEAVEWAVPSKPRRLMIVD